MFEETEIAADIDNIFEQSHFNTASRLAFNLAAKSNDPAAVARIMNELHAELGDELYRHVVVRALDLMTTRILGPLLAKLETNDVPIRNELNERAERSNRNQ